MREWQREYEECLKQCDDEKPKKDERRKECPEKD